ncbi:MAG: glycosyltransferase family 4 protein [Ruminococcaceae bacterium]|nr:glycosyltransferase family 4 protein [Oscillospiraceae bacterium]
MKKHILVISQYFHPEQFRINDMATEWVNQGYKVTVLTGIPNYPQGKFYDGYGWFKKRKELWNGMEIIRIPLFARGKTAIGMVLNYFSFVFSGFFWKSFTKVDADLVFTFEVSPMTQALIGVWYAKRKKIPNYLYVQDLWPENVEIIGGIHNKTVINAIGRMVNYIYKNCDKIFATSPSFVEEIRKRTPQEEEKVIYWPQYAEEFYKPSEEKSDLIPQDEFLNITFTGNIGTAQGLEILPTAARILKEKNVAVRFNMVGDGRNKENLLQQIRQNKVEEYFNMVGRVPATEIPSILSASDAAFLSFAENPLFEKTIPAKLQSYMACGIPIIAAAQGESKRIIEESGCGVVSEIGNADSLVDIILKFNQTSSSQREQMKKSAIEYCDKNFNKKVLFEELNKSYLKIE